ncbi:MAG: ThuA domain-containing protein [Verrucomicrobiae bacterium]|nr:ThuA domain-containing protein [Verrucomicrobiae bacterium]NNJ43511.1 ThuA domain-containing protein [Akkermansiaceae bacterium]
MKLTLISAVVSLACLAISAAEPKQRILFFSKSSGFEHPVISWKKGQPSHAEKVLMEIGKSKNWEFEFSKDGSKFSKDYLAGFDTLIFYTTGDLTTAGKDKHPPMTQEGKTALLDYVNNGGGFIGLHCATDTFKTQGVPKQVNNHDKCGAFICMVGGEFNGHGKQQEATNLVVNPKFPGYENLGKSFTLLEEWYALKHLQPDMHVLQVLQTKGMMGNMYKRPNFPVSWARMEGKGKVYYNAMGHREDVWTNDLFKNMIIGAVQWTSGDASVEIPSNLKEAAPGAMTNQYEVIRARDK